MERLTRRASSLETAMVEGLAREVRDAGHPLDALHDLDPLMDYIGNAKYVLLGEASHGTSEYYLWRARITQRLVREKGFSFIAVEGDWPDCYQINRYVKGYPDSGETAFEVLDKFKRWPTWMWANWEIIALTEWLQRYNQNQSPEYKVGFYGLDVYSLWDSMRAILDYLEKKDPSLLEAAKRAFNCFMPYSESAQDYAWATAFVPESCEEEVITLLHRLRSKVNQYPEDREAAFDTEQNALVAVNAEKYYRAMIRGGSGSWNIRDVHMADTLDRLMHLHGDDAKGIVWEHNTHIGDARFTDMADEGMLNVGQLARERHAEDGVVLVGFGSHRGSVIAAKSWGGQMENMVVPPAAEGSWEDIFHRASHENRLLLLEDLQGSEAIAEYRGHRAIGVVYNPALERFGNYVPTSLPQRYDAFLFINETRALHPIHIEPHRPAHEPPETYPWGV